MKKLNQRGSILILMTLGFVILGFFIGMAVDFGRGYLLRARLSRLVDAAALAAAKVLKGSAFQDEAMRAACDSLLMNGMKVQMSDSATCMSTTDTTFKVTVDFVDKPVPGGGLVKYVQVKGSDQTPTTFLNLLGLWNRGDFSTLHITAFAEAGPERPLDLMLVLDRSGSMGQTDGAGNTKFQAMKITVNNFLGRNFTPYDRIGMTSFGKRGCGTSGGAEFTGNICTPNMPLGSSISNVMTAVNNLQLSGTTNTMEGLRTARTAIQAALNDPTRASSRKVVLLITDGQPTALRLNNAFDCQRNPITGAPLGGTAFTDTNGCYFVKNGNSEGIPQSNGLTRYRLNTSSDYNFSNGHALYLNMMAAARNAARDEADQIRALGSDTVVMFAIAIGEPKNPDATARLDANAKCLLARIANDPTTVFNCDNVYTTPMDGDTHNDLKKGIPSGKCSDSPEACINPNQQNGRVYTVDLNGNVAAQMQMIFEEIAIFLKLRLTV